MKQRRPGRPRIVAGRKVHGPEGDAGRQPSLVDRLLGSSTRVRLLTVLLTNPGQEFYLRELQRRIGVSPRAAHYELANLEWMDLLTSRRRGRERFYMANTEHPIYQELKQIIYKTVGLGEVLRAALGGLSGVEAAFIYGSVAKGTERVTSDIDLIVLGDPDQERLDKALRDAEAALKREVNLTKMSSKEWRSRLAAGDSFVTNLKKSKKIMLIGNERSLRVA